MKGKMKSGSIAILLLAIASLCNAQSPEKLLNEYRNNLNALRKLHPNVREMPDIKFFLFGMGDRKKIIYKNGSLIDAKTKQVLYQWKVSEEIIVPPAYSVYLKTTKGPVQITEDRNGVYPTEKGHRKIFSGSKLNLPAFKGHPFYPLTWESYASDADYNQMDILDSNLVKEKICLTHTWHAAEMFLYLQEKKSFK